MNLQRSEREQIKMGNPHILAIPYPAQGHVIPLMEFSQRLLKRGIKITFVNTDFNHQRVVSALMATDNVEGQIHLVSIPDGMETDEDRNDLVKLSETMLRVMPEKLEELIRKINERSDSSKITCVLADETIGWALQVAEKMGIHRAAFWPAAALTLVFKLSIHKLIDDGIIDNNGESSVRNFIDIHCLESVTLEAHKRF